MNLFYANGTPVINSLKIQSEVPLDPRLNPETIEERDSLVTKHIAYDRMKVYVKETDSEYVYHKDKNKWVILSKFEKEEKDKLENIKNYLVDTEIIYDKDNNLLYREHSYDPNTNITSLRDYSIPEATVLGDGTLYNGLLSKFYVNRLNNVTGYQTDAKITSDTETESLFLTVTKYNPDTDESVTTNLNIPLVTDDNNGLVSPEKKHWMDNADGLSNTGTTSQTWQLQKSDIDTRLDPNGGVIIKNSGGKLEVRNNQDNSYAPVTLGDIIIEGNVTQKGESFITQAETVEVRDNTILLNRGETAAGVSKGFAGIEIDRGTLPKFQILFDESDRRFKAGEEGDLWCLALRDDDADMLNGMFTSWDSSTKRLKTTNIIPSDRKLAFTDNNSYLQLTSHSFSGDALSQTLRYSNSLGGIFISAGNSSLNLDTDKTAFYFHKNITLPSTISSVSDFLFKRSDVTKLSLKDTVAQFTVPVTAITFNRASDGSEVLYHADLENTEFKNYITIAGPNDVKLYLKSTDEDNYNLISSVDQDGNKLSNMGYYGSYWAIENNRIAVYKYDANGYPEIINQDGTSPGYLRACTSGFLPNVSGNLASGGNGYLGTSSWAFANAYIANNHSNKYYFGTNDVFLDASATRISARTTGAAIGMNVGSLLVSNDYSDETKVPNNGIYSKGAIKSYTGFTSDFRISNLTITKTGSDVLHISSFASDPENMPGTDPISSQVINDGVALTYFWQGDFAFQLVGDIDGTGMAYRRYTPSTGASGTWKFLADTNWVSNKITSVAGNYLPLAGGTMTGSIIMSNNISIAGTKNDGSTTDLVKVDQYNSIRIGSTKSCTYIDSMDEDLFHNRGGFNTKIWDSVNLKDPATKSGDNAFTGTNSFEEGKFSVGSFKVDINSSLEVNLPYKENETGWSSGLNFKYNSLKDTKVSFGSMGSTTVANYAYIGIGNVSYSSVQYKFYPEKMSIPESWSMLDGKNDVITLTSNSSIFGRISTPLYLRGDNTDLFHTKNSTNYKIWDASNLPTPASTSDIPDVSDMARRSEANTFTANNTFTAGQFNVGPFEVTNLGSLSINMSNSSPWERYLIWSNNSAVTSRIMFGGYGNGDTANYAWIGIGDVNYTNAQYIFTPTNMQVPLVWSLDDLNGNSLVWSQAWDLVNFGRSVGTTKIRSGNVDLIHKKGSTDYKILDESNYSQYLPTTSKWTYGFVGLTISEGLDLNTVLNGANKPKTIYNYTAPSYLLNSPTNATYGSVWQLWNSLSSDVASLSTQLYFDINHNVENGTRYMYFRTSNNKGFGDSSNWKRVLTSDEDVTMLLVDTNGYPTIKNSNGTEYQWLRTPTSGLLPNKQVSLAGGGNSYIGTSDWCFQNAYISNVHANRYYIGGVNLFLSNYTDWACVLGSDNIAKKLCTGSLLVSNNYANTSLVPSEGIFASGRIISDSNMLVGYSGNITGGMLGYGLNYDNTFAMGMGSEYSSGALILYKLLNPNIGKAGYNVPRSVTGTPCYLKLANGTLKLGVGATKAYTAGEAVTINEYEMATKNWATNTFYPLAGKGYLSFDANGRPVMRNNQGYSAKDKDGIAREIMWVSYNNTMYLGNASSNNAILDIVFRYGEGHALPVSAIASQSWATTQLANYLPLSGGTLSGNLTINTVGSTTFVINNNDTNGSETFMKVLRKGTASAEIGFMDSLGAYIYNYNSNKYLFIDNDGYARVGTTSGSTRLALITDIPTVSGYLPLTGGILTGKLTINTSTVNPLAINDTNASATEVYIQIQRAGTALAAIGNMLSNGSYIYNYATDKYLFVGNDGCYFGTPSSNTKLLTSTDLSSYATQSWCNGQFAPLSRFNTSTGYTTIKVTRQEFNFDSDNPEIYMNYRTLSGSTAVTKITWKAGGGANSTALCEGRWGNLYMNNNLVATQSWATEKFPNKTGTGASGTWDISISGNATTASTASKLGSTTIGGTAKPIYLSAGTATACSATVGSSTVPVYMNAGTITQCSTTLGVSITGNAATATTSTKWNGYDIWVGTESQLPSSRSSTTIYIVTDA